MPIWVMIVAPTGIAAIVLLTWWLGGLYRQPITRVWLERVFANEEPPLAIREDAIGRDGRSALVLLDTDELALVTRVGDGLAWRPLGPRARVSRTSDGFFIRLRLPTFPSVTLKQSEQGLPASVRRALEPFVQE